MTKRILLATAFVLLLPAFALAQESVTSDEIAIRQTVQYYFDGWKNNDVSLLKGAFHPQAKWLARSNTNVLVTRGVGRVYVNLEKKVKGERKNVIMRVVSVDMAGKAASVKAELVYPEGIIDAPPAGVKQTEYLSLIKFSEGWRIVGIVYSFEKTSITSYAQSAAMK